MITQELKARIEKKEEQIKKIEKRIEKWSKGLNNEQIELTKQNIKYVEFDELIKKYDYDARKNMYELRKANYYLNEAQQILVKYQNALMISEEKENKPVIQIFKNFFENWKTEIKEFTERLYQEYLQLDRESCDLWNNKRKYLETMTEDEYKEKKESLNNQKRELLNITWVAIRREKGRDFDKYLDKYMEDRYYELVEKVTKYTGTINDVKCLYIGSDGSLNGSIVGDNGTARVETIIAGGWNIQCRHYRVLVHKVG